jgi:hypothetical protein
VERDRFTWWSSGRLYIIAASSPIRQRAARAVTPRGLQEGDRVHAYFWFRVWRRQRHGDAAAATFRHLRAFLLGTVRGAWDMRYGLLLRGGCQRSHEVAEAARVLCTR